MAGRPNFPFQGPPGGPRPGMPPFNSFPGGPYGGPPFGGPPGMFPGMMGGYPPGQRQFPRPMNMMGGLMNRPMMTMGPGLGARPLLPGQFPQGQPAGTPAAAAPAPAEKSTTVYVGKIAATLEDSVVRQLLDTCGKVKSWKRAEDPETKQPKGFGFCEFEEAEGCLRAIRVLNNLKVDGQELLLKGNTATMKYLEEYEKLKKDNMVKTRAERMEKVKQKQEEGEVVEEPDEAAEEANEDNRVLEAVISLVSEREDLMTKKKSAAQDFLSALGGSSDMPLPPPPPIPDSHKGSEERDRDRDRKKEKEEERMLRDRERDLRRDWDRERREEEDRKKEQDREYEMKLREWEKVERERGAVRTRESERKAQLANERRMLIRADVEQSDSDDDLEPWERRPYRTSRRAVERRRHRQMEEEADEVDRQRESQEQAKRQRLQTPEQMSEMMSAPGHMKEEMDEVKPEVSEASAGPNIDLNDPIYRAMVAVASAPQASPLHQQQAAASQRPPSHLQPTNYHASASTAHQRLSQQQQQQQQQWQEPLDHIKSGHRRELARSESPPPSSMSGTASAPQSHTASRPAVTGPALRPAAAGNRAAVAAIFADDEEEDSSKRKLKPIQYNEEEMKIVQEQQRQQQQQQQQAAEELKQKARQLMDTIPTTKEGVWTYSIKWSSLNQTTMKDKFTAWIGAKVQQMLGMADADVVNFVMGKLAQHTPPASMAAELAPVLDTDTDTFVLKLYRMVIYEAEKAAAGLV